MYVKTIERLWQMHLLNETEISCAFAMCYVTQINKKYNYSIHTWWWF